MCLEIQPPWPMPKETERVESILLDEKNMY